MIAAGTVYVTGALGFEAIGGHFVSGEGFASNGYIFAFLVEETLEIAGLTLFLITLLAALPNYVPAEQHNALNAQDRRFVSDTQAFWPR